MTGIERLREWAAYQKEYVWCPPRPCPADKSGCESCMEEYLLGLADQIERETLQKPRFEDGEVVQIGDKAMFHGTEQEVDSYSVTQDGDAWIHSIVDCFWLLHKERAKRSEPPDSWERIEADAKKGPCVYYGRAPFDCTDEDGGECRALNTDDCNECMALEIVRRCKALAGVE